MSLGPLKVAFLWHMHQPCYKDPRTGVYRLPWVRLHAVKDYYDMAARLDEFPRIKANFNLVPSLVEQLQEYASGSVNEVQLQLARKHAEDLTNEEKLAFVKDGFLGNRKKMIEPYPRYRSLLEKCPDLRSEYKVAAAIKKCGRQDFLDLQVWANLAWVDPTHRGDPFVADLLARGRQFTDAMKTRLLERHMEIVSSVLPKYRELADAGRIELAFSPYFHPILPILCDSEIARVAMPDVHLPKSRVRFPEDARMQIALGLGLHKEVFGRAPVGMWPPEGGVSDEALAVVPEFGIQWTAADEGILEASSGVEVRDRETGEVTRPDLLYKPHRIACGGGEVSVFFRDKMLSDLISFNYMKLPADEAAADFMGRLGAIRERLGEDVRSSVVVVALDGENCWEFYEDDGDRFLRTLYSEMSTCDWLETVRLCDVLDEGAERPRLKSVYPGSWINSNFAIWIGSDEDNAAWDMICEARARLVAAERRLSETEQMAAWRSVYAAEGSDWFWWYGGEHASRHNPEYDALFRSHIRRVYDAIGMRAPAPALRPIIAGLRGPAFAFEPAALIKPVLDGRVTTFYEWRLAGLYESYKDVSRHMAVAPVVNAIYFGFDHENLYLRIDTTVSPQSAEFGKMAIRLEFDSPAERTLTLTPPSPYPPGPADLAVAAEEDAAGVRAVAYEIIEIAVPFAILPAAPGDKITLRVAVLRGEEVVERRPFHETIALTAPTADFEAEMWSTL